MWLIVVSFVLAVASFTYKSITSKVSKAAALAAFSSGFESTKSGSKDSSEAKEKQGSNASRTEEDAAVVGAEDLDDEWGIPTTNSNSSGKYGDNEPKRGDEELGESGEIITYNLRLRFVYLFKTKIVNIVSLEMSLVNLVSVAMWFTVLFNGYELFAESSEVSSSESAWVNDGYFKNLTFGMLWISGLGLVADALCGTFATYCRTSTFFGAVGPALLGAGAALAVVTLVVDDKIANTAIMCAGNAVAQSTVKYMFHTVNATCYDNNLGFVNCFLWMINEVAWVLSFVFVAYGYNAAAVAGVALGVLVVFIFVSVFYVKNLFDDVKWISIEEDKHIEHSKARDDLMVSSGGDLYSDDI